MPAFFEPTDHPARFVATDRCAGSWSPTLLHGGPPAALLARTIELLPSSIGGETVVTRLSTDILGPIPVGEVAVTAEIARPGRTVELVEARLAANGRTMMVARAWRMRVEHLRLPVPAGVTPLPDELPGFPRGEVAVPALPPQPSTFRLPMWNTGYADAVEWRFISGGEDSKSPVAVWARPRVDLVSGEGASPLVRLMILADTGNGLSRVLDVDTWWFINTELTVHLHRVPAGDWFLLAARSIVESHGTGLTETELFDRHGRLGRAAQALLVGAR